MIKVFYFLPKRPDISDTKFHRHWREVRSPLELKLPGIRQYVRSHRMAHPGFGLSCPYEGVAEYWFDSLEAAKRMRESREFIEGVFADEANFVDRANVAWIATQEHEVLAGPPVTKDTPGVKALFFPRRKQGVSVEYFQHYWRTEHGPLVPKTPGLSRYVQCHVLFEMYQEGTPVYDGVAELCFPDLASVEKAGESTEFQVEQLDDARKLIDLEELKGFLAEEVRVIWP